MLNAKKFDFRETDNDDNCSECDSFDKKSYDGVEANCKMFHIKTDKNHICDLLQAQFEESGAAGSISQGSMPEESVAEESVADKLMAEGSIANETEDSKKRGYVFIVIGFISLVIGLLNLQTLLISHSTTGQILLVLPGILLIYIGIMMVNKGK